MYPTIVSAIAADRIREMQAAATAARRAKEARRARRDLAVLAVDDAWFARHPSRVVASLQPCLPEPAAGTCA